MIRTIGLFSLIFAWSCSQSNGHETVFVHADSGSTEETSTLPKLEAFLLDPLLNSTYVLPDNIVPADDIWRINHTTITSIGKGIVLSADSTHLKIQYVHLENAKKTTFSVIYAARSLQSDLEIGDTIHESEIIGYSKVNHTIESGKPLEHLANKHFTDPKNEPAVLIIDKRQYHMWWLVNGSIQRDFDIALGQDPVGHKKRQGDNKTPEGEYFIVEKLKGPFSSPTGPYLGNSWFRLNYPNTYDAEQALLDGRITVTEKNKIDRAFALKKDTPNNTSLGGDIGIHGWNGDWYNYDTWDITWGCVSMRNSNIDSLYPLIRIPTKVLIL